MSDKNDILKEILHGGIEKVLDNYQWKSIEFVFHPSNQLELLLRLDFAGTQRRLKEAMDKGNIPQQYQEMLNCLIRFEKAYQALKKEKEWRDRGRFGQIRALSASIRCDALKGH